jgi:hypothetical protein
VGKRTLLQRRSRRVQTHKRPPARSPASTKVQPHYRCKRDGHDWVLIEGPVDVCAECKGTRAAARKPMGTEVQLHRQSKVDRLVQSHSELGDRLAGFEGDDFNDEEDD